MEEVSEKASGRTAIIGIVAVFAVILIFAFVIIKTEKKVVLSENMTATVPQNVNVNLEQSGDSIKLNFASGKENIAEVQITGPENSKIDSKLAASDSSKITTDVFAIKDSLKVKEARITLPKRGIVQAIFYCPDYDFASGTCNEWQATKIPFTQTDKTITFTVSHFTAYAGGGLNASNLVIWDETDLAMPFAEQARQPGNNTFFFADYTNTTSGNPVTNANVSINFSDSVTANMTYNSTSGMWVYNRTFASEGAYFYTVNATSAIYENLTATDDVLIASCVLPSDDYYVNSNTRFCIGTYQLNDSGTFGIIIINASNITADFTNSTITGNLFGTGLYVFNVSNVTINDFSLMSYSPGFQVYLSNGITIYNAEADKFAVQYSNNTNITGLTQPLLSSGGIFQFSNNTNIENSIINDFQGWRLVMTGVANTILKNVTISGHYGNLRLLEIDSPGSFYLINVSIDSAGGTMGWINVTRDLKIINTTIQDTLLVLGDADGLEILGSSIIAGLAGFSINNSKLNNSEISVINIASASNTTFFNSTLGSIDASSLLDNSRFFGNSLTYFNASGDLSNITFENNIFSSFLSGNGREISILNNTFYGFYGDFSINLSLNSSIVSNNTFLGKPAFLSMHNSEFSGNSIANFSGLQNGFALQGNNDKIKNSQASTSNVYSGFVINLTNSSIYNLSADGCRQGIFIFSDAAIENSTFSNSSDYDAFIQNGSVNFKNVVLSRQLGVYGNGFLNATNLEFAGQNASVRYEYFNTTGIDIRFSSIFILEFNKIFVNPFALPDLNRSANISFRNLPFTLTPQLLKDGIRCDNDLSLCNITSYDYASGTLVAQVASFSNYTANGTSCLNVTDDTLIIKNATLCPGNYSLPDTAGNGIIIINASNIALNCYNANITGDNSGIGINLSKNNTVLFNCFISNYSSGISLSNANGNVIRNSRFFSNSFGLFADNSGNNLINLSQFIGNTGAGIFISSSQANNLSRNTIINNTNGIAVSDSSANILNNSVSGSSFGILLNNNTGIVAQNRIFSGTTGIFFNASSYSTALSNLINSTSTGILAEGAYSIIMLNNKIYNNSAGLVLQSSSLTNVTGNSIYNNSAQGINIFGDANDAVAGNNIFGNGFGINISYSSGISVSSNNVSSNTKGIIVSHSNASFTPNNIFSNQIGFQLLTSNITAAGMVIQNNTGYDLFSENSSASISSSSISPLIFIDNTSAINITPLLLVTQNTTINYSSVLIDNNTNTTNNLFLLYGLAGLLSENVPELNLSARIAFYNLLYSVTPFVLKNGIRCDNTSDCTIISYNNATGTLVFNVTSFTNYTTSTPNVPGTPDNVSPTPPTVVDGLNYADYDWTNSNNTLYASWFGSEDRSKIFYSYRIMVNSTGCYNGQCALKDAGENTQATVNNLTLSECSNYSFQVQAEDTFYNIANLSSSDGIVADLTPPAMISLNSPTHPDPSQVYASNDITFNWSAADSGNCPSGIYGYSYIIDNSNETIPDDIPEIFNDTNISISSLSNGIWYFHIKARDVAGGWSSGSTFQATIAAEGVSVILNSVPTPTLGANVTVYGGISPANASYLLKIYVNNTEARNQTIANSSSFNFSDLPVNFGVSRIYANAYVNGNLKATSNSIYVERLNATRVNATSLTVQFSGGTAASRIAYSSSSSATFGVGTDSPAASVSSNRITANASNRIFIFVTKPSINVTERNLLLQNSTFFDLVNPSLGYPLDAKQTIISTILNYQDLFIEGNSSVQTGRYTLVITNNGTREGKPQIIVRIE